MFEDASGPNSTLDKGGYSFPFQKRARSNSPPRNSALFGGRAESPLAAANGKKPVVATNNFVLGRTIKQKIGRTKGEAYESPARFTEFEEVIELSTGPTDEERNGQKQEFGENWMYQRINHDEEEGGDLVGMKAVKGGNTFLQLLNTDFLN